MRPLKYLALTCMTLLILGCGEPAARERLIVSGSSTLAPLMEVLLDDYAQEGYQGSISLDSIGTRAGFDRFLQDSCNLVTASRPATSEELRLARDAGSTLRGYHVAMDAVSICTGGGVTGDISTEELSRLLTADSWRDVRLEWPDQPVRKYYPGLDSGTFAYMVDALFDGDTEPILSSTNLQFSEDDHVLVQGILGDPWALGFFGYSYALESQLPLTILSIDGLFPEDGAEYALSRPLFLYFDVENIEHDEAPAKFAAYALDRSARAQLPRGFLRPDKENLAADIDEVRRLLSEISP